VGLEPIVSGIERLGEKEGAEIRVDFVHKASHTSGQGEKPRGAGGSGRGRTRDEQHSYLAVHKRAEILNLISSDAETIGNIAFSVSGVVTHTTFLLVGCLYIWNLLGAYLPWIIVLIG